MQWGEVTHSACRDRLKSKHTDAEWLGQGGHHGGYRGTPKDEEMKEEGVVRAGTQGTLRMDVMVNSSGEWSEKRQ